MGFKNKITFGRRISDSIYYSWHHGYHVGIFGYEDYLFWLEGEDGNYIIYLTKYRFPNISLNRWALYKDYEADWDGDPPVAGAGTVVAGRLYFYNRYTKCVEWVDYKDDIGNFPERHQTALRKGTNEANLQFEYTDFKGWTVTPYRNKYLFHCDIGAHRILVTDLDGNFKGVFGEFGSLHGQFNRPCHCAVYHHPEYGDVLFVADRDNGRITVWQIVSIEPDFEILPINGGITGLTGDNRPQGVGIWRNQLYVHCHKHKVKEFKINDDLTLEDTGAESSFSGNDDKTEGVGLYINENHLAVLSHDYQDDDHNYADFGSYVVSAIENTMEASFPPLFCFATETGLWKQILFSIKAGQQGPRESLPFSITAEGYQQINNIIGSFKFSGYSKHDICAIIQSIPFSIKVRQRQIEESLPFSFLGHCNYMLGSAQLSLMVDIISNIFLSGENVFTFNMIANSPLTFKTELTLEVPEAEGTLVNDTIALFNLILPEFILLIQQAFKVECKLSCIQPSGKLASPSYMSSTLSLFLLQLQSSMEVPHSFSGQAVLNIPSITALSYQPDLLSANITLSSLKTNGITYQGFDYAEIELTIELLSISSQMVVIPLFHAFISLPALEIDAHEGGQIASIEEIYQNSSLTLTSGEYPQVDGVELLGIAINLLNKSISRIANTDYMIIDLGYLDLHKGVVNQYLEVFISGYTPNQNQPIGELQIGSYSYLIEEWVTENEWRVLIGKGLTRKTTQNTDKRFIPIKLKLKPDFELRSVTIRATPVARRGR